MLSAARMVARATRSRRDRGDGELTQTSELGT